MCNKPRCRLAAVQTGAVLSIAVHSNSMQRHITGGVPCACRRLKEQAVVDKEAVATKIERKVKDIQVSNVCSCEVFVPRETSRAKGYPGAH